MGRVIVVGAGVVGLTSAVRLLEAGHRVDVVARDLPLESTSAVAAALWYPYLAQPQDLVTRWSSETFAVFAELAERVPEAAVRMVPGTEVLPRPHADDPWWREAVPSLERVAAPGYADAWSFTAPVIEMPAYLRWLVGRIQLLGGTVTRLNLSALPSAADLVVNCAGLGSRLLADDTTVTPVRGQVVYVQQFGLDRWWLNAGEPTYLVPREHDVVVGGTDVEGQWSRTPDPAVTEDMLARAARLVPQVREALVLGVKVGLRPARPRVRVERVDDVIHCYGHGGAGVTLSWGTADEVVRLAG